jgi:hypothetical protein
MAVKLKSRDEYRVYLETDPTQGTMPLTAADFTTKGYSLDGDCWPEI